MSIYNIGFLPVDVSYQFQGGSLRPHTKFEHARDWISRYRHHDGFVYPPVSHLLDEEGKPKPNSDRPQHLHRLPASHSIHLDVEDDSSRSHGVFVLHLLGYLHRTWLQMEDWWFDSRVPVNDRSDISFNSGTAQRFLSHSYAVWQNWPSEDQTRFTNILYMLNRAVSYEWDWEHFVIEYILADACYKMAVARNFMPKVSSHAERINAMCRHLGLAQNDALVTNIVKLRNDLFHESMWDRGMPCSGKTHESFMAPLHLRRLNQRLITALLGFNNDYVATEWWGLGTCRFQ